MSSESGRFNFRQECGASMLLLADGPCHFLTGCVCVLLCFIKPILGNRYGLGVIP